MFTGGGWWVGEWQTKFNVSPGPGLWSLVLGPYGPDLGPGPELDNTSYLSFVFPEDDVIQSSSFDFIQRLVKI